MKRIRVVIAVATPLWDESVSREMNRFKDPDTELEIVHLDRGPESIEDAFDDVWAAQGTLQEVLRAEQEGCQGVIIYCYADPALHAAKIGVRIPVVGLGEASAHFASLLGPRFGIITVGPPDSGGWLLDMDNLRVHELDHKCVGVKTIGIPVLGLAGGERVKERVVEAGRDLMSEGATVLTLGCGSLFSMADAVSAELGVPVILPAAAALKLCEAMIVMGVAQSKRAYTPPAEKNRC